MRYVKMEKFDKLYEKFHGAYFAIMGVVFFFIMFIIAVVLYFGKDPTFSLFTKYISDLGAGPDSFGNLVFNIGLIGTSILMIFSHIFFARFLENRGGNSKILLITLFAGIISSLGLLFLGIFPKYTFELQHQIASYVYFGAGVAYLLLYGLVELKIESLGNAQAYFNFFVAIFYILYLIFKILVKAKTGFPPEVEKFTEWLMLFSTLCWFLEFGILTLKKK
ncbi:MAG: DUF998 domain-containing protein [Promethearchaeota archaeon]|nr:MAG: DUF998 domain-containing protein [Candidatus Lokiarchaeota archaeon]